MTGNCDRCGKYDNLNYTFGDYICQECLDEQSTDREGHSGMVRKVYDPEDFYEEGLEGLNLVRVRKSNTLFVDLFFRHYPDSKGIIGRQINYLIYDDEKPIGAIAFASPIYNYNKFKNYFDEDDADKLAKETLNNNIYRLTKNTKNYGTRILRKAREAIYTDYQKIYQDELRGLCTFVKPPRTGAVYKADNWDYLGMSKGITVERRGKNWTDKSYKEDKSKHIYAKELNSSYKQRFKQDQLYKSYEITIRGKYSRRQWLKEVDGLGLNRIKTILNDVGFDNFISMSRSELTSIQGIGAKTSKKIKNSLKETIGDTFKYAQRSDSKAYLRELSSKIHNLENKSLFQEV